MKRDLTQSHLKSILRYEPDSGHFFWLYKTNPRMKMGEPAGCMHAKGYRHIRINKVDYKASRLAFLYMTGSIPEIVDHANRVRDDDRWCNLRAATFSENSRNKRLMDINTSGEIGVYWNKPRGKWYARCRINGMTKYLGSYDDIELAALVASEARAKYYGEFAV